MPLKIPVKKSKAPEKSGASAALAKAKQKIQTIEQMLIDAYDADMAAKPIKDLKMISGKAKMVASGKYPNMQQVPKDSHSGSKSFLYKTDELMSGSFPLTPFPMTPKKQAPTFSSKNVELAFDTLQQKMGVFVLLPSGAEKNFSYTMDLLQDVTEEYIVDHIVKTIFSDTPADMLQFTEEEVATSVYTALVKQAPQLGIKFKHTHKTPQFFLKKYAKLTGAQQDALYKLARYMKYLPNSPQQFASELLNYANLHGKLSQAQHDHVTKLGLKGLAAKQNIASFKQVIEAKQAVPDFTTQVDLTYLEDGPLKGLVDAFYKAAPTARRIFVRLGGMTMRVGLTAGAESLFVARLPDDVTLAIIYRYGLFKPTAALAVIDEKPLVQKLLMFLHTPYDYELVHYTRTGTCCYCRLKAHNQQSAHEHCRNAFWCHEA